MRWLSLIAAVAAGALAYQFPPDIQVLRSFASAAASVAATLLGFLVAALSILTAVLNRRLIINLRKTGHYDDLVVELLHASIAFLAALVVSMLALFVRDTYVCWTGVAVAALLTYATCIFISAGRKFALVVRFLQ
jgi:hypothetical protein